MAQKATDDNEPTIIKCKFGMGSDHVKGSKLDEEEISKEIIIQINNTSAMKMDANMQNKEQHCDMQHCNKAVVWFF